MSWLAARIPANDHNHGDRVSSWSLSGPGHKTAARTGRCPGVDVCEACGERNPAGSAFCVYCGVYLGWDQRDGDDQSAAPTATNAAQAAATAPPATGPGSAGSGPYAGGRPDAGGYPGPGAASPGGHP